MRGVCELCSGGAGRTLHPMQHVISARGQRAEGSSKEESSQRDPWMRLRVLWESIGEVSPQEDPDPSSLHWSHHQSKAFSLMKAFCSILLGDEAGPGMPD